MRVEELMTTEVQTIGQQARVSDARELMQRNRIHHLVVMDNAKVVGVISDRDVRGVDARGQSRVEDVMTRAVVTVAPEETVRKVANLMRGRTVGCVPVVKGQRLRGILTVSDLLTTLGHGVDRPSRPKRHALHYRTPHRKHKGASGVW